MLLFTRTCPVLARGYCRLVSDFYKLKKFLPLSSKPFVMIKSLLKILPVFFFITPCIHAQNPLPNASFDAWTTVGIYEDPNNWNTLNSSTAIVGVLTALKATGADVHSGSNAIKLITKNVLGQDANGIATTGTINTTTQTITGGIAYTGRPDSIGGWYKYTSVGGDNGFVAFILLDGPTDTIGFANFTTPVANIGVYTYFSVPVNYFSSATPSLARCLLSSSAGFTQVVNSTIYIDDLALISNSTGIRESIPTNSTTTIIYRPGSKTLDIHSNSAIIHTVEIFDLSGKKVYSSIIHSTQAGIILENFDPGVYMVRLFDESLKTQMSKKIMIE